MCYCHSCHCGEVEKYVDQSNLVRAVHTIKRSVSQNIGTDLPHEFRSHAVYQGYTGLCGEAEMAAQDGELDGGLVDMLQQYADKVVALWRERMELSEQ